MSPIVSCQEVKAKEKLYAHFVDSSDPYLLWSQLLEYVYRNSPCHVSRSIDAGLSPSTRPSLERATQGGSKKLNSSKYERISLILYLFSYFLLESDSNTDTNTNADCFRYENE